MFWSNRNCLIVDLRCEVIASCVFVVSILICNIFKTLHVSTISSFFLVKQYSIFNLRVKGETDRAFNILTLLHVQRMHPEWTFKNVMFSQRFPKKEFWISHSLSSQRKDCTWNTFNKWRSLGVAKLVWNVQSLSTWPTLSRTQKWSTSKRKLRKLPKRS